MNSGICSQYLRVILLAPKIITWAYYLELIQKTDSLVHGDFVKNKSNTSISHLGHFGIFLLGMW